jgi:hypothetical protein
MKLKQKLCKPFDGLKKETANELEKIADDYAVNFGYWILRNFNNYGPHDEKELLEIFKKEKRL